MPGNKQEHDVCEQLLLGQPVLRLACEQAADDIVGAPRARRPSTVSTNPCNPSPADRTRASSSGLSVLISRPKGSKKSSHHRLS